MQIRHVGSLPGTAAIAELIVGNLNLDGLPVATADEILRSAATTRRAPWTPTKSPRSSTSCAVSIHRGSRAIRCRRASSAAALELRGEPGDSPACRILKDYWNAFLRRHYPQIAKTLEMPLADLEPAIELIRTLETRPGREFNNERTHYIEPDVHVLKVGDEYVIQLNDDGLPKLRISRTYRRMLQQMRCQAGQSETQQYISEKMRSALWLIKSLDQRQRTIYKVATSIVAQQREFFDHGIDRLRPMVLRDVAEDIGMHESTVSRVVSNKYMHTPRGLFPLKFFSTAESTATTARAICRSPKRKIRQLIENEDARYPLSDSELMRILNREGIQIARRTVAGHRDELNVPSSRTARESSDRKERHEHRVRRTTRHPGLLLARTDRGEDRQARPLPRRAGGRPRHSRQRESTGRSPRCASCRSAASCSRRRRAPTCSSRCAWLSTRSTARLAS
ncbi:MAG: hypothetical protein R2862_05090 [Thermoanaerobaculia bacterium]